MSSSLVVLRMNLPPLLNYENVLIVSRPFIPDADEPTEADASNEPYLIYYEYLLSKSNADLPQVISHSYGDDEQVSLQ